MALARVLELRISGEPAKGFEPLTCCLRIAFHVLAAVQHISWSLDSSVITVCSRSLASAKSRNNCCKTVALSDT